MSDPSGAAPLAPSQSPLAGEAAEPRPPSAAEPLRFTGSEQEFARIWFVNLALTILTLGIYAAWGKVRTRRYLYGHTRLAGEGFEYTADPLALLKGYLLSGAFLVAYSLASEAAPLFGLALFALGVALFPWMLWLSLRFNAQNTGYLGLRLRFRGALKRSYRVNLLGWLATALSFGTLFPLWQQRRRRYAWSGLCFGDRPVGFGAGVAPFYWAALVSMGWAFLGLLPVGFLLEAFEQDGLVRVDADGVLQEGAPGDGALFLAAAAPFLLVTLALAQAAWTARTHNAVFRGLGVGPGVSFDARLSTWRLMWRYLQNNVLLLLTLGLAYPWTRIATWRLLTESISVRGGERLAETAALPADSISALGDAASSLFEIDLGL